MHKCVFERMYTELLMGALQAMDLLSPAKTEQIFYQQQEEEKTKQAEQTKKAAPAGRRK